MDWEKRWIRRVQTSGHEDSANKLVKKYYKDIFAFVYRQVFDQQLAMDLTQEVFIRVLQSISRYDAEKASFRTWLYRIATNHCTDYFRSKAFRTYGQTVYLRDIEVSEESGIDGGLASQEAVANLYEHLRQFDPDEQQIIRYKFFFDMTFREIAAHLTMSESTVKTKYYSVLRKLRNRMEAEADES